MLAFLDYITWSGLFLTVLKNPAGFSSYLALAVLARLLALLLVAEVVFFEADVRVDVFLVVDWRVGVLLLPVFVDLALTGLSAAVDAVTFFLVVEVRLVVFGSAGASSAFSVDGTVFLRVVRLDVPPSCWGFSSELCCRATTSV